MLKENSGKKCIAIHLPVDLLNKINDYKAKSGKSQSGLFIDLIEKGLGISRVSESESKMLFFVKVRIDTAKMMELGQKLQSSELDTSQIIMTYCIKDDPAVGMGFWQADNQKSFEEVFAQHRVFYKEVLEIIPVITPMDSMKLIMEKMQGK
jgi:hypothetical protein